ncbi:SDR family oxidoreductase [Xylophilus sp. GW821-FHT01B05]
MKPDATAMYTMPADTRPRDWMRRSTIEGFAMLVVGAGSGMGAACARAIEANGGRVALADLNLDHAQSVATEIVADGGDAFAIKMDVASDQDCHEAVAQVVSTYGCLDALINTATWSKNGMLESVQMDEWREAFQTNVHGPLELARACLPHLRNSPSPSIVHVGSLAGVNGFARHSAYGTTKGALITMSRQMAFEWAVDGIRVNVVIPGTIDSPLAQKMQPAAVRAERFRQIPLGRLGHASEMADLALFWHRQRRPSSPARSSTVAAAFLSTPSSFRAE